MADVERCSICDIALSVYDSWTLPKCRHHFHRICIRTVYDELDRRQGNKKNSASWHTCPLCQTFIDEQDLPPCPFADSGAEAQRQDLMTKMSSFSGPRSSIVRKEADWLSKEGQRLVKEFQLFNLHLFVHKWESVKRQLEPRLKAIEPPPPKSPVNASKPSPDKSKPVPVAIEGHSGLGSHIRYKVRYSDGSTALKKVKEMREEAIGILEEYRSKQKRIATARYNKRMKSDVENIPVVVTKSIERPRRQPFRPPLVDLTFD